MATTTTERATRHIGEPPALLRAAPARSAPQGVDPQERVIYGAAVLTRGEALGHDLWLDSEFARQVAEQINAAPGGVKARFTHPGLSADGLGKYLGRVHNARLDGDVVRGDLHLSEVASKAPDGDLAGYVMELARKDPAAFGMSIVFSHDRQAEKQFEAANADEEGEFQTPDADNAKNLPHARLSKLWAADVVDDPAANPTGMFHRGDEFAAEADRIAAYALGLSDERPGASMFGIDADRVRQFAARFLSNHGLALMEVGAMSTTIEKPKAADVPSPAPAESLTAQEIAARFPEAAEELRKEGRQAELNRFAELQKRFNADPAFVCELFADGRSPEQAEVDFLKRENVQLAKRIAELEAAKPAAPAEPARGAKAVTFKADAPGGRNFESEVTRLATERNCSVSEATRIVAREQPELYRAYQPRR